LRSWSDIEPRSTLRALNISLQAAHAIAAGSIANPDHKVASSATGIEFIGTG